MWFTSHIDQRNYKLNFHMEGGGEIAHAFSSCSLFFTLFLIAKGKTRDINPKILKLNLNKQSDHLGSIQYRFFSLRIPNIGNLDSSLFSQFSAPKQSSPYGHIYIHTNTYFCITSTRNDNNNINSMIIVIGVFNQSKQTQ